MIITVNRFVSDDDTTISQIYIDGKFECFGLEDSRAEYKEKERIKVYGKTRVPAGKYKIGLRKEGGFHNRYRQRFGWLHEGMLEIKNVPDYQWVLIHCGNTHNDTAGCLLVGTGAVVDDDMMITNSVRAYKKLYEKVIMAAKNEELWIEFIDSDK